MGTSDFQNLLDLDYPVDKGSITAHDLWDRWRNHKLIDWRRNKRADGVDDFRCDAYGHGGLVDITEHTLNGKVFICEFSFDI